MTKTYIEKGAASKDGFAGWKFYFSSISPFIERLEDCFDHFYLVLWSCGRRKSKYLQLNNNWKEKTSDDE